jgi:hypothetical protein
MSLNDIHTGLVAHDDSPEFLAVVSQLAHLGIEHRELLDEVLHSDRAAVAEAAAGALADIGDQAALDAIQSALLDSDPQSARARMLYVELTLSGDRSIVPFLEQLAQTPGWEELNDVILATIRFIECPGLESPLVQWEADHFVLEFLLDDVAELKYEYAGTDSVVSFAPDDYERILGYLVGAEYSEDWGRGPTDGLLRVTLHSGRAMAFCRRGSLFKNCSRRFKDEWSGVALSNEQLAEFIDDAIRKSSN